MLWLLLVLEAFSAGSYTLAKAVVTIARPLFFVGVRMSLGGIIMYLYCVYAKKSFHIKRADYGRFAAVILVHVYLSFSLGLIALQYMPSSTSALFFSVTPIFTALFSYYSLREGLSWNKILGILLASGGCLSLVFTQNGFATMSALRLDWPDVLTLASTVCLAYGWVLVRGLLRDGYSASVINTIGMLGGAVLAFVTSIFFESWPPVARHDLWRFTYLTLVLVIVINVVHYSLYSFMLKRYTATFIACANALAPVLTALFSWWYLGERVGSMFFVSLVLITAGLWLFYQEELIQDVSER